MEVGGCRKGGGALNLYSTGQHWHQMYMKKKKSMRNWSPPTCEDWLISLICFPLKNSKSVHLTEYHTKCFFYTSSYKTISYLGYIDISVSQVIEFLPWVGGFLAILNILQGMFYHRHNARFSKWAKIGLLKTVFYDKNHLDF